MAKNGERQPSKTERDVITYQRVKNISAFMEHVDARLTQMEDDLGLLVALGVADDTQRKKIVAAIQEHTKAVEAGADETEKS